MKLLFDENLSFRLCRQLSDLFPGSSQVRLLELERADDRAMKMAVWKSTDECRFAAAGATPAMTTEWIIRIADNRSRIPAAAYAPLSEPATNSSRRRPVWISGQLISSFQISAER